MLLKLSPEDNVGLALSGAKAGERLPGLNAAVAADIPAGHKVALVDIASGREIVKYGQIIGFASQAIPAGAHVHTHNVSLKDFARDYAMGRGLKDREVLPPEQQATFQGYLRPDGRAGARNYVGILASVSCSASVASFIAAEAGKLLPDYPNVDGVVALTHGGGCCAVGEGFEVLQRTIAGYAENPNFAGSILLGLGCEGNLVDKLARDMALPVGQNLRLMNIQDQGGTSKTVAAGLAAVKEMLAIANQARRVTLPASHLTLAMECGGSDAYSGISANPVMGAAADLIVKNGGTAILAETPEIYGAEHLLTRRVVSPEVGEKLLERVRWWEKYTAANGAEINNNPSPGNKAGGLTTILEKSLGAVAKAGSSNLAAVYKYAEKVTSKGLVFMDTPGNDVVSITGMVAGGANLVCFTTGRGTVYGSKPAPTIKLASNTPMHQKLADDMDLNCGLVVDGEATIAELGKDLFALMLATASGRKTKSEALGFGDHEFVPWHLGVVM